MAIFNPPNVTLTAQTLTPAQASIAEGGIALVKYNLSGALAAPVTLNFALQGWGGTVAGAAGPVAGAAAPDYGTVVTLKQYTDAGHTVLASTTTVNTGNCQPSCRLTACDYAAILNSNSPSIFSSFSAIC